MGEFDFYFSFYGLLLSLSAGTVIIRFADVVGDRRDRQIGFLGPLLGLFVLLDITSFWIWAWRARTAFQVNYAYTYFGLAIAVAYFFSASQVFPKETGDWNSLDEHYWKRKRYVLPGIIVANVAVIAHGLAVRMASLDSKFWYEQPFYWVPLLALLFTRKKAIDLALLTALCVFYVGGSLILKW